MTKRLITPDEIKKLARLSKLAISEDEIHKYSEDLSQILNYVSQLETVDTNNVEPLLNILDYKDEFKSDEPEPSVSQKIALKNSKESNNGFFQVPKVIKKDV